MEFGVAATIATGTSGKSTSRSAVKRYLDAFLRMRGAETAAIVGLA